MKIEPGIYPGVSFADYAAWEAINHSKLVGFKNTPAHARELIEHERPPTPAKEFGWMFHLAVLEPARYTAETCLFDVVGDKRKKEIKPLWEAFKKSIEPGGANAGKKVLTLEDAEAIAGMAAALEAHPLASEYLKGPGHNELSICWKDKETGELCKSRFDRISGASKRKVIIACDLKSHEKPAHARTWERTVYDLDYGTAAAMYLEGFNELSPAAEQRPFVWIVVETNPPYLVRLFSPSSDLLLWGHQRWHGWLRMYAECKRTGVWQGWEEGVEETQLPPWVNKVWELGL